DVEINKHIESKIDAEKEVTRIKAEIDAGTFRRAAERRAGAAPETGVATVVAGGIPSTVGGVTFDAVVKIYVDRVSKPSGKESWKDDESRLEHVCAYLGADGGRLGDRLLSAVTLDELEAFYAALLATRAKNTCNHYRRVLQAAFRWAAKKGYLAASPIPDDP